MIYALLAVLFVMLCLPVWAYMGERKIWNKGLSPDGTDWLYFDTDSQGGRGYKNLSGDVCWISYPGIDTNTMGQ